MQHASRMAQIKIYTKKCFRLFINGKGWTTFISAAIIAVIISAVTGDKTFVTYNDTRNGAFAFVCACIWIGLFNSIQSICGERDIIKRENRTGLHISSYVMAHMIYEMALCLIEALIVTVIISIRNGSHMPEDPLIFPIGMELCVTFFLIIYSSDVLGLAISSIVKTANTAMTVMPFVLIIQLVMSGMIFKLEGITEQIAKITISKWGLQAICSTADAVNLEMTPAQYLSMTDEIKKSYEHTAGHLSGMWAILIAFAMLYGVVSIIALKFVDKDKR